ncbi:uncharacterized protein ACIQIH_006517 isoform 1-T1 [Cyanocitta cristata]
MAAWEKLLSLIMIDKCLAPETVLPRALSLSLALQANRPPQRSTFLLNRHRDHKMQNPGAGRGPGPSCEQRSAEGCWLAAFLQSHTHRYFTSCHNTTSLLWGKPVRMAVSLTFQVTKLREDYKAPD